MQKLDLTFFYSLTGRQWTNHYPSRKHQQVINSRVETLCMRELFWYHITLLSLYFKWSFQGSFKTRKKPLLIKIWNVFHIILVSKYFSTKKVFFKSPEFKIILLLRALLGSSLLCVVTQSIAFYYFLCSLSLPFFLSLGELIFRCMFVKEPVDSKK